MKPLQAIFVVLFALIGGVLLGYKSGGRQVSPGMFWVIIAVAIGVSAWNRWRRDRGRSGRS